MLWSCVQKHAQALSSLLPPPAIATSVSEAPEQHPIHIYSAMWRYDAGRIFCYLNNPPTPQNIFVSSMQKETIKLGMIYQKDTDYVVKAWPSIHFTDEETRS